MLAHLNSIAALNGNVTVLGANAGPFTVVFNNALANVNVAQLTTAVTGGATATAATVQDGIGNELQTITLAGTSGGTFTVSFNGVAATWAITFTTGSSPTAAEVLANLNSIAALNGNVTVLGGNAGPFFVVFKNALASADVPQMTTAVTGGTTATVAPCRTAWATKRRRSRSPARPAARSPPRSTAWRRPRRITFTTGSSPTVTRCWPT